MHKRIIDGKKTYSHNILRYDVRWLFVPDVTSITPGGRPLKAPSPGSCSTFIRGSYDGCSSTTHWTQWQVGGLLSFILKARHKYFTDTSSQINYGYCLGKYMCVLFSLLSRKPLWRLISGELINTMMLKCYYKDNQIKYICILILPTVSFKQRFSCF